MGKFKASKVLSALTSAAILLTTVPLTGLAVDEKSFFVDVAQDEYCAVAAENLAKMNVLQGYPDGTFAASKGITRAEIAAVVLRSQGLSNDTLSAPTDTVYSDVTSEHWASGYISKATELKLIQGDGNGTFRPNDNVKYEEAVKIIVCSLGLEDAAIAAGGWVDGYIKVAQENGILSNVPGSIGSDSLRGDIALMTYQGLLKQLKPPVASVNSGKYTTIQNVSLSTEIPGATIYYTLDGQTPTTSSTKYTSELSLHKTTTLKAIVAINGSAVSDVFTAQYDIILSSSGSGGGGGGSSINKGLVPRSTRYDVIFEHNYGGSYNVYAKLAVSRNTSVAKPLDPVRAGYVFIGWYWEPECVNAYNFYTDIIVGKTTLYAKWLQIFDVTFDLNYQGAKNSVPKQSVNENAFASQPTQPTREGFAFGGWYKEPDCQNKFNFTTERITKNTTLYAKWGPPPSLSLTTSGTEFILGQGTQVVYFYAEADGVDTLQLVNENNDVLAQMKDDGLFTSSGDDLQNDNVFSCKLNVSSMQEGTFVFKAVYPQDDTVISNDVTIHIIAEFTATELADIAVVDSAVETLLDDQEYAQADVTVRKSKTEQVIDQLCDQELLETDSVFYDDQTNMFSFSYKSGILGAVFLEDFADDVNGLSLAERDALAAAASSNAKSDSVSPMDSSAGAGEAIILNAFGNTPFRREFYEDLGENWNGIGLTTEVDTEVTVEDVKNLQNYEVIVFSGHGAYYTYRDEKAGAFATQPVWCLNERATSAKDKLYSADLKQKRIIKAHNTYYVAPALISDSYSTSDLQNSFVFSEACEFMGKNGLVVEAMADAFMSRSAKAVVGFHNSPQSIYSRDFMKDFVADLVDGKNAQAAFDGAIAKNGENHNVWFAQTYPGTAIPNLPISYPLLRGNASATLFNTDLLNGDFEMSSTALTYWDSFGDARVISKLGEVSPSSNALMAILTTGIGSGEADYLAGTEGSVVQQTIKLDNNVTTLSFDYNVISEEPTEFIASQYDDTFKVEILDESGSVVAEVLRESVNTATWIPVSGIDFEGGDHTVYQTGWKRKSFDISEYKNKLITIRFVVYDVGDSIYDTATVVDDVRID